MTEFPDADSTDDIVADRDDTVEAVRSHAGQIARQLALLQGGDYGQRAFKTDAGEWTLKYEAGDLEYLRFSGRSGDDVYVVSTKQPPEPSALHRAMTDYDAFVESYNRYVRSLEGVLDDVRSDFPKIERTESVVTERNRLVERIRDVADAIAGELHRYDGTDYGTFSARVNGARWELKRENSRVSYLRVGGQGGTYLVSQYEPPSAPDVREHADDFAAFVDAYNDHVGELEADLSEIEL
ncbi:hypothetical protein AUR64_04700 [Haloprofundus marisrubri]|uniref:Profilin fold domain-containing protein n=1 Tax=Haloprofundus marisrubri TaxID=1514971 RepID=A0A0W1RDN2_9EURY|nr:hypothetical protein [Haloprofundus marisrubri]KTG11229.1 hypothetical protein AUR64_04700 [Haloprofundus marisrubri]